MSDSVSLADIRRCLRGGVPSVIATAAADGTPNVTYLSTVHLVDHERVALSNQFFSKTSTNLSENPCASVLVLDPVTYDEYRLELVFERTERRGPVFESLREELDAVAALSGMQDVFRLRAADIYRVVRLEPILGAPARRGDPGIPAPLVMDAPTAAARMAELAGRLGRAPDLDALVEAVVGGLDELLGYENSMLALRDEGGERLYVIASHGYDSQGVGSELAVGDGPIGMAAERCSPVRVGAIGQMTKYGNSVRRSYEEDGAPAVRETPLPNLPFAQSLIAVPAMAMGQLVGVLVVETREPVAYDETDVQLLGVVATLVANAIEIDTVREQAIESAAATPTPLIAPPPGEPCRVRFFDQDGSVFLDGDYLIKGVAGRILWALVQAHVTEGRTEFTNRELRLDPALQLPEYRANLESRLILLKRRLDEREAPVRIEKTGRGRFRLDADVPLALES